MPDWHDFKLGDKVVHAISGAGNDKGIVEKIEDDGAITVLFVSKRFGREWRGTYDKVWFRSHPRGIVHEIDFPEPVESGR